MILTSPTKIILPSDSESVKRFLTFKDKSVDFMIAKAKQNYRWKQSNPDKFQEHIENLKSQSVKCLMKYDRDMYPWTYSGLAKELHEMFGWELENNISYPEPKIIPWAKIPPQMRYYQKEAVDRLIQANHGAISLPTGAGKSICIFNLLKHYGLKSVVMTPSSAITDQLYEDAKNFFGSRYVGKYGDGSKKTDKLFTIATGQALTRIEPDTEAWNNLSKTQVFISDESHTTPATTFEKVCFGLVENAPYRFFVSATQIRQDGFEMTLKGITGPIVYEKTFTELVDEGFLAKPVFKVFRVPMNGFSNSTDPNTETRNQFYLNPNVNKLAAQLCDHAVKVANRQVVIMVDEFKQFLQLKAYMTTPFEFVHGGASQDAKEYLPTEYWNCHREKAIQDFNDGKVRVLIGTSAISTGVDLRPTGMIIMLTGGKSEIQVKQALGRGSRLVPGKKDFWVVDFEVVGSPTMQRHLNARKEIYSTMGSITTHG